MAEDKGERVKKSETVVDVISLGADYRIVALLCAPILFQDVLAMIWQKVGLPYRASFHLDMAESITLDA